MTLTRRLSADLSLVRERCLEKQLKHPNT